ncbi:MAG: hypothetical protein Kow00109_17700 [Acidobacteriota bacterium]
MLENVAAVCRALGHPNRLRIVAMLEGGPLCSCQITAVLGIAPSTVSAHLKELVRVGVVETWRDYRWVHSRLTTDSTLRSLVDRFLKLLQDDPQVRRDRELLAGVREIDPVELCRADLDLVALGLVAGRDGKTSEASEAAEETGMRA